MSELIQAATTIREIAVKLRGFELAAAALERVGSFEQAAEEAHRSAVAAQAEAAAALADRDSALREAEQIRAEALAVKNATAVEAERVLAAAGSEAGSIVADAQAQAKEIVDGGRASAAEHMKSILAQVYEAETKVEELKAKGVELARANVVAENALAATEAKISKAREQIASLLKS